MKRSDRMSLFLLMSKSIYFESLYAVYVTAENEEAQTDYVSTDHYIYFCLKRFSNISSGLF